MSLKLHVVKGKEPGQVITVPENGAVVIGRKNADVCLDDQMLSRQHMKVELRAGQALIADLGSSNGTFLNGDRVVQGHLADGDKIKIGGHIFHVEFSAGAAGAAGSAAAARRGLDALAGAAHARREMVFCTLCYRAVPREQAKEGPGGIRCPDCVEGSSFNESMIEGFKLVSKVADGRLGPIFKAKHLSLHKYVLVKIIRSDQAVDERTLRRFAREAKIGGRLHHPNIVEMYDAAQSENGHYYITLELVDGETLEERVSKSAARRIDARETLKVGAAVAEALRHAWETQKIVHRNVKPSNIFLGVRGEVKLGDFGLAKSLEMNEATLQDATGANEPWGTLHFMPPEQLEDARLVDARADVYALGASLYYAVTGVRPFESETVGETLERVRAGAIEPADKVAGAKHCPRGLGALIARAMDRDKARRFPSAAEMLQGLQALGA